MGPICGPRVVEPAWTKCHHICENLHAAIAKRQRLVVHPHRAVLQRAHDVVGRVQQLVEVSNEVPAQAGRGGDDHLQRRVTRTYAHAGQTGVHTAQPSYTATMLLATPRLRLWWACMPVCVSGLSASLKARKRSRTSFMLSAPLESTT